MKITKQNEPLSSLTHFIGLGLAIAGLVLLVVYAAKYGNAWHIVSFSIFGASMIVLYSASAIYHYVCSTKLTVKRLLQKFDHAMIYVLIAGTYTPIALVPLRGGWGWSIFGIVWAIAVLGVVIKTTGMRIKDWQSVVLYLGMGWLIVIAIVPLIKALPAAGLFWLAMGGISYTIGVIFFSLENKVPRKRWFGVHEVFHIFVMIGTFSHFWMMFKYIMYIS